MNKLFREFEEHCSDIDRSVRRIILLFGLLAAFGAGIFTGFAICQIIITLK